jgi:hypothetical protein
MDVDDQAVAMQIPNGPVDRDQDRVPLLIGHALDAEPERLGQLPGAEGEVVRTVPDDLAQDPFYPI